MPGPTEGIAVLWRSAALELVAPPRSLLYSELGPEAAGLPAEVAGAGGGNSWGAAVGRERIC